MASLILLVEDDPMLSQSLTMTLTFEGFEVHGASNLEQAKDLLKTNTYSLLLLDVNLPDGNGIEFCEKKRRRQLCAGAGLFHHLLSTKFSNNRVAR